MAKYIFILLMLFASSSFAQVILDTLKIDSFLIGSFSKETNQLIDPKVVLTIQAIDKNLNSIVQEKTTWYPQKFTVIGSNPITIRKLVDRKEALLAILSDTLQAIDYQTYWEKCGLDTIKFLSSILVKSEFDLHYPSIS